MKKFEHVDATSVQQAISLLGRDDSTMIAGGTDLLGMMREGLSDPVLLVNLRSVPGLAGVSVDSSGGLRIGSMTTITELSQAPEIQNRFPILAQAAESIASPQIRNMATVSGNLCQRPRCWYFRNKLADCYKKGGNRCFAVTGDSRYHAIFGQAMCFSVHPSDLATALVALDARVRIAGPKGEMVLPLEKFFVTPREDVTRENSLAKGEILTEISVPPPAAGTRMTYIKERERGSWDFATAGVAAVVKTANGKAEAARIVLGGVAAVPWRALNAEQAVAGAPIDERQMVAAIDGRGSAFSRERMELAQAAAAATISAARPLSANGYKIELASALIQRGILATT